MNRRTFLERLGAATAGLIVGAEALDIFARLTHQRTLFPSGPIWTEWMEIAYPNGHVHRQEITPATSIVAEIEVRTRGWFPMTYVNLVQEGQVGMVVERSRVGDIGMVTHAWNHSPVHLHISYHFERGGESLMSNHARRPVEVFQL